MGLDLDSDGSNNSCHMPYSYFYRVREAISDAIGLPIHFMDGFLDSSEGELHLTHHMDSIDKQYRVGIPIDWNILKYDALYELIYHSDCGGILSWRTAGKMSKRLNDIKGDVKFESFGIHKDMYEKIIKLFNDSYNNKKTVNFY